MGRGRDAFRLVIFVCSFFVLFASKQKQGGDARQDVAVSLTMKDEEKKKSWNTFLGKEDNFGTDGWQIDLEFSLDVETDLMF